MFILFKTFKEIKNLTDLNNFSSIYGIYFTIRDKFFDCFLCEVKKVKITFLKLPDFMSQNIQLK